MRTEQQEALIDKYLLKEMTGKELLDFEEQLHGNTELADEVRFQQEVFNAISDTEKIELRKTLKEILNSRKTKSRHFLYSWKLQGIAATFLLAILIGGTLMFNQGYFDSADQKLFDTYFQPDNTLLTVRTTESLSGSVDEGMHYYENKEYEKAIEAFQKDEENLLGKLYSGFSYMKLEKYNEAEEQFLAILENQDNLLIDQAEWNLGLCYLVSGQTAKAKATFTMIANGETNYNIRALELLTKMDDD